MTEVKSTRERLAEARQLERVNDLDGAAVVYQKIVDADAGNQDAVSRLLVMYRKLKDYRKELEVINMALAAYVHRDKDVREKWIREHPKAAGTGKSMWKQLGGASVSASGMDPIVSGLQRRKELVNRKLAARNGKDGTEKKPKLPAVSGGKRIKVKKRLAAAAARKKEVRERMAAAAKEREKAASARREMAGQLKQEIRAKREAAAAAKAALLAERKAQRNARLHPSLFVISLSYSVSLESIDAAMPLHMAFLKKHYANGTFLVSGRQVPRTGGIIIARANDRAAIEKVMRDDPFVKKKLISMDIVEFTASQMGKGWKGWVKGDRSAHR